MSCHTIDRAFQHCDVNVGWFPYRATTATTVSSKPGAGVVIASCPAWDGLALQSVRNPSCSDHPRRRPPVKGSDGHMYVWGYKRYGAKTGWLRADLVEPDPNFASKPFANGPAREDFEVGREHCEQGSRSGCGKKSLTKPLMVVTAATVHYRYSPRGTSMHYLHQGDQVRVLIANGPHGFHFTQLVHAAPDGSAKPGARGWIITNSLTRLT